MSDLANENMVQKKCWFIPNVLTEVMEKKYNLKIENRVPFYSIFKYGILGNL
jgi:hypothetical protein